MKEQQKCLSFPKLYNNHQFRCEFDVQKHFIPRWEHKKIILNTKHQHKNHSNYFHLVIPDGNPEKNRQSRKTKFRKNNISKKATIIFHSNSSTKLMWKHSQYFPVFYPNKTNGLRTYNWYYKYAVCINNGILIKTITVTVPERVLHSTRSNYKQLVDPTNKRWDNIFSLQEFAVCTDQTNKQRLSKVKIPFWLQNNYPAFMQEFTLVIMYKHKNRLKFRCSFTRTLFFEPHQSGTSPYKLWVSTITHEHQNENKNCFCKNLKGKDEHRTITARFNFFCSDELKSKKENWMFSLEFKQL